MQREYWGGGGISDVQDYTHPLGLSFLKKKSVNKSEKIFVCNLQYICLLKKVVGPKD